MAALWSVGVGGVFKPVSAPYVGVAGAWKAIAARWDGVGGVWKQTFASISATISGGVTLSGATNSHAFGTNTVSITGGIGPFTYQWHESDDFQGVWTAAGTGITQTVNVSGVSSTNTSAASYYCTVTDTGTGLTATTNTANYGWTHL